MLRLLILSLLASLAQAAPAPAADKQERSAAYYRYYDDKQGLHLEQQVTEEHLKYGYEELDSRMQVIRKVPPRPTAADMERLQEEKRQRADVARREREDQQLLRLYSAPRDAVLARDRKLDSIQLRIDFSNNAMSRLRGMRAQETQKAAGFERNGKPVPKFVLDEVARLDKQIADVQTDIQARKAEQDAVRAEFEPTIKRLEELTQAKSAP